MTLPSEPGVTIRIIFERQVSRTTQIYLDRIADEKERKEFLKNLREEAVRFAVDWTRQFIDTGLVVPVVQIVDKEGNEII